MAPDPVGEAVALHDRALSAWDECRYPLAADLCRRALELLEAHAGAGSPDVANVLTLLGGAQDELGAHGEAEAHHRRAAGIMGALPSQPDVLLRLRVQAALGLAGNLRRQGRYAEAERVYLAACDDAAATWTALEMVPLHNELGVLYKFAGRFDDAQARYAIVRAVLEDAYGAGHPVLGAVWHNLAGLAHSRGDLAEGRRTRGAPSPCTVPRSRPATPRSSPTRRTSRRCCRPAATTRRRSRCCAGRSGTSPTCTGRTTSTSSPTCTTWPRSWPAPATRRARRSCTAAPWTANAARSGPTIRSSR